MRGGIIHRQELERPEIASPIGHPQSQLGPTRFADAWKRWYPHKTEEELATRAGIPVGTAKHYLRGTRKISARALHATDVEIMRDQR